MYQKQLKFSNFYNLPGEGIVAEFTNGSETFLFDIQGLQYRIVHLKQENRNAGEEEKVLARLNSLNYSSLHPKMQSKE